jgi:hypothetical protein
MPHVIRDGVTQVYREPDQAELWGFLEKRRAALTAAAEAAKVRQYFILPQDVTRLAAIGAIQCLDLSTAACSEGRLLPPLPSPKASRQRRR